MSISIGILVFDGAEELDFVGPWEVFAMANEVGKHLGQPPIHDLKLIAEHDRPVVCAKGMRVLPDLTIAQCAKLDVLLIPSGQGTRREATNRPLLDWIATIARTAKWVTSVCTGALLPWASSTSRTIRARVVSLPILVASNLKLPVLLMVAPMTSSPDFFSTGMLSPVIIDSSRLE